MVPIVGTEGVVSVREARHPILLLRELEDMVGSNVDVGREESGAVFDGTEQRRQEHHSGKFSWSRAFHVML